MIPLLVLSVCFPAFAADVPPPAPPPPVYVATGASAPAYRILEGKGEAAILLGGATSPEAAVDLLTLQAGAVVAPHIHATSAEFLYVLDGSVEMVIGGVAVRAGKGDVVRIPAGVEHGATVTSALSAVQVYVGPGPEQRFAQGTRVR